MDMIEEGDTVQVVGGCCSSYDNIMWCYSIAERIEETQSLIHTGCGRHMNTRLVYLSIGGKQGYIPIDFLRKVPPLTKEEKQHKEELVPA